jgi:hypothetical protein
MAIDDPSAPKNIAIERWFEDLRATWADPSRSAGSKIWVTLTNPVILIVIIAIIVLVVFLIKCSSKKCDAKKGNKVGDAGFTTDAQTPQVETSF